jgi:cytochrome c peroxidase
LGDPPPDPSNRVADDPRAAALGEALFADARLSGDGSIACASCHIPDRGFQDDRPLGVGTEVLLRRTMPLAGVAWSPWLFWDGRKDSLWSQALGPLEHPGEHASDRLAYARLVSQHYREPYEAIFGPLPDLDGLPERAAPAGSEAAVAAWAGLDAETQGEVSRVFADIGKALAAYERTILPERSRFDDYADAVAAGRGTQGLLTSAEERGLAVFLRGGQCSTCHNGPLLSDRFFHNTGIPEAPGLPRDLGRWGALAAVREDPFNCLGAFSDAGEGDCGELRFMATSEELIRAFKTPSLRGVADRPPYMHAGQVATLADAIAHYARAPWAPVGLTELHRIDLSTRERADLEAFLRVL